MSYSSKRMIVSMSIGIVLCIGYAVYALSEAAPAPDDLSSWALAMLVFIGIGIVAVIIVMILFQIALSISIAIREKECDEKHVERVLNSTMLEDEREKLIDLRSSRVSQTIAGAGFIAFLVVLAFGAPVISALHVILASALVGSFLGGFVSIYHYEKGI